MRADAVLGLELLRQLGGAAEAGRGGNLGDPPRIFARARDARDFVAIQKRVAGIYLENGKSVSTQHGPGCLATTGYRAADFAADPYLWFCMVHPDDRDRTGRELSRQRGGEPVDEFENRYLAKDGSWQVPRY